MSTLFICRYLTIFAGTISVDLLFPHTFLFVLVICMRIHEYIHTTSKTNFDLSDQIRSQYLMSLQSQHDWQACV
jgi:hypothetical protein